ncbi:hypothetical protein PGIGA_G00062620 [Pangasianodon gigas]|uniref:Uncharacterized protein n=1 Tax=Pangasianodon gigas TaxID=30993 RepID=A0ACC5X5X4_PANGG|nr:hypothetical protein [Pangasianodon gigas]
MRTYHTVDWVMEYTSMYQQGKSGTEISKQKRVRMCLECRKARSRVAAQSRREKESQLFRELAALLPLAPYEADQLDKASVIRVTISYLHLRALLGIPDSTAVGAMMHPVSASQGELPESIEKWLLDTLEGFLLLMSLCGKIIFITKDVISHIGIKQMDLIGRSLFDFIHPSDHKEIKEILTSIIGSEDQQKCEVFFRIKGAVKNMLTPWQVTLFPCLLDPKGDSLHWKQKVVIYSRI